MDYSKQKNQVKQLVKGNHHEKLYSRVWLYILRVLCIAVLTATFAVAGVVFGTFMGMLDGVPEVSLNSLSIDRQTSVVVDQEGNKITELMTAEQRTSIAFEEMPEDLINAVIAIEDSRFYSHNGIDLEGILRAGVANLAAGGTAEGGSTITQQMIKKMVLTSDQTWKRKIQEWYLALQLEYQLNQEYGKERTKELILESYLNYNYLGNSAYGVEAASQRYFGKPASEMNLAECALIAGLFNAPSAYDPILNTDGYSRERQVQVLDAMLAQGYITQEEYNEAKADDVFGRVAEWNEEYEGEESNVLYSYFVDSVISQAQEDLQEYLGCSELEAYNTLFYGGLTIHITQDSRIQGIIDDVFADASNFQDATYYELDYRLTLFDKKDPSITDNFGTYGLFYTEEDAQLAAAEYRAQYISEDMIEGSDYLESITITEEPQYSLTVIDQHTGYVVGLAGGRGEKQSNLGLNRAIDTTRQPGSTFKILASYVAALDVGGFGCGSSMDEAPFTWGDWSPKNWDNAYSGFCTMREGITDSKNIVTARFMQAVGVETNFDYVENMGITTLRREPDENGETDMVGSLCLGSGSVTNLELCGAYATIANAGEYIEPILYTHITDKNGNVIYEKEQETRQVMKESTAYMLADMMRDVVTSGTGTICNFDWSMAIAGKTGTTDDSNDFAFVGFTPYYTCTIQAGFDYISYPVEFYDSLDAYSLDPNGAGMLDSGAHKYLWNTVMGLIHEPLEAEDSFFEKPDDITYVSICKDSGKLATPLCSKDPRGDRVTYDMCTIENAPTETCDAHIEVEVCKESGKIATKYCPATETKVFITRTDEHIAEIGASSLSLIADWKYTAYDVKYAKYAPKADQIDSKTELPEDYVQKYAVECTEHLEVEEESSAITPATQNSSLNPSANSSSTSQNSSVPESSSESSYDEPVVDEPSVEESSEEKPEAEDSSKDNPNDEETTPNDENTGGDE